MEAIGTTIRRGALAGLVGGATLALWFLGVDLVRAEPFATPTFVAGALLGLERVSTGFGLLALYTAIHFAAFATVGIIVAWVLIRAHIPPLPVLGLVLGFLLFDLIFYAGVVMSGMNVVRTLGWPQVLVGNLIAGVAMIWTIDRIGPEHAATLRDTLRQHRTIREGLVAGLLGAVGVMLWFLLVDVVKGRIFFTPGALGSALFHGARGTAEVQVGVETVLGYSGVHLAAFMLAGIVASGLVEAARRSPPVLLGVVLVFVTLQVLFIGVIAIIAAWLLEALPLWTIILANVVAAISMGAFLLQQHPEIRENLTHELEEEEI
jgi:hypothetical protein